MERSILHEQEKPRDATEIRPERDQDSAALGPRSNGSRRKAFDARTRSGKRYKRLVQHYSEKANGRHDDLVRGLAAMLIERERLEYCIARGERIDIDQLLRLSSEIRRTAERLGVVADEPGEDATAEVIARIRAQRDQESG